MPKITLDTIGSGYSLSKINENFQKLEDHINDKVLSRDPDGNANFMVEPLDMNSQPLLNLPEPSTDNEPLRVKDVEGYISQVQGSNYTGESPPPYQFKGLRWYVPSTGTTYVWDVTNGNGSWVEEPVSSFDGQLRKDLEDGSAVIGGVEAKDLFNYPKASAIGIKTMNTDLQNGALFQSAINTYGGIEIDLDFSYSIAGGLVLPSGGAKVYSQVSHRQVFWTGSDTDWAIKPVVGGSYQNKFKNWSLIATSGAKKLFDAARVRESQFENFNMIGGNIGCRLRSSWYTRWTNCRFANGASAAGSKGLHLEFDGAEPYNVVNLAYFESCQFDSSHDGIIIETGGEGIVFSNCGIEVNKRGVLFQGQGGGRSIKFAGNYIEGNELGNVVWNKTGAGEFYSIVFEDNYFGTENTSRAGIVEFVASNGGNHWLTFLRNKMRDFGGAPSQNVLLDVNGATMAGIYIEWFANGQGAAVPAFNRHSVNWRYMKTDVVVKLAYVVNPTTGTPFEPAYSNGYIFVSVPEFGKAEVSGTFKSVGNAYAGPLNVTEEMPISLHPAALEKCLGATITDADVESSPVTVMINGGQIRTTNLTSKVASFNHTYSLDVGRLSVC